MAEMKSQAELDQLANEALTLVELAEARLLSWGFMRVQSNLRIELPMLLDQLPPLGARLWARVQSTGVSANDILDNMVERRLVFESGGMHRSRFAEGVRLLFLLRQRFRDSDWQDGPRLVSDLRLHLQRRRYPRRDVDGQLLLDKLDTAGASELEIAAAAALLAGPTGEPLMLAQFQLDAAARQMYALRDSGDRGIVIGAGTGAGKTKAFYIPALAHIAGTINSEPWTKALAIYPRIELLKDQLAEAYSEARKLDSLLRARGLPGITVGAYYGDTPTEARWLHTSAGWVETSARDGWIFPAMACPECHGNLVWLRQDVAAEVQENSLGRYGRYARVRCDACGHQIGAGELLLTREQMIASPPDILFTTTEMLNRRLSRTRERELFGADAARPPRLMLLDEIHTYEGLGGAHVAHLLRRWRHARGRRPGQGLVMVGLSATLARAEQFFARLTGLAPGQVSYITPSDAEMVEEGIEYNLVLKGDPVSGTSLLSTSVQTNMLLARMLDAPTGSARAEVSRGAYGQKVFAFTDTLDVINRWYHIEQDAETHQVLSRFRTDSPSATREERQRRNDAGQIWWACEQIGHDLEAPLALDLTSSQYRGVRPDARLVIATSTLEVGFNDPAVGAVVQHKAPRSMASFLQRKGRAGRMRGARPWMVVVTSAYGRDRWAFQHAEALFSPALPPIELPLENLYVRKMQACYALMDWLAVRLGVKADVWALLSSDDRHRSAAFQSKRRTICILLNEVLVGGTTFTDFSKHLDGALGLGSNTAALDTILWAEPRPLLLEVLPTLLRQIESDWQRVDSGAVIQWADDPAASPMPEFVTPNLFSQLSLPELTLHIPQDDRSTAMREDERMGLVQGMGEFAPGHVSKRYARSQRTKEAHWFALPDSTVIDQGRVQLRDLAVERESTPIVIQIDGSATLVYRPRSYTLAIVPTSVLPTSTARLLWRSALVADGRGATVGASLGAPLALPTGSPWRTMFTELRTFIQASGEWAEVTRAAVGVRAETRYTRGSELRRRLRFTDGDQDAALGFRLYVDAMRARFAPLDWRQVLASKKWAALCQHLLPAYALYRLSSDVRIVARELSDFEIGWLWQLEFSMLVATAVARQIDLQEAAREVARSHSILAERTMDVIFQSQRADGEDDLDRTGRLRDRLAALISEPEITNALVESVAQLWSYQDSEVGIWLETCYAASLGAVLFDAVTKVVSDIDPDDLTLDIEGDTIWISEQAPGGVGVITRIAEAIARRPRDLELQLTNSVRHCDRALLATQLGAVAEFVSAGDPGLASAFTATRTAKDMSAQSEALQAVGAALERGGTTLTRDLAVALSSKFLRPNSSPDTDALVAALNTRWREEEARLGCEIDVRVMAVAARRIPQIDNLLEAVLSRVGGAEPADESQKFNLLQSLLWLDCHDSCPDCIERNHLYQQLPRPSRALLSSLLELDGEVIEYGAFGWEQEVTRQLVERASCTVVCTLAQGAALKTDLITLLAEPVEIGFQQHYAAIERVERSGSGWFIGLMIRDLQQF